MKDLFEKQKNKEDIFKIKIVLEKNSYKKNFVFEDCKCLLEFSIYSNTLYNKFDDVRDMTPKEFIDGKDVEFLTLMAYAWEKRAVDRFLQNHPEFAPEGYEVPKKEPIEVLCTFKKEIPLGTTFDIEYGNQDLKYLFQNQYFSLVISYK